MQILAISSLLTALVTIVPTLSFSSLSWHHPSKPLRFTSSALLLLLSSLTSPAYRHSPILLNPSILQFFINYSIEPNETKTTWASVSPIYKSCTNHAYLNIFFRALLAIENSCCYSFLSMATNNNSIPLAPNNTIPQKDDELLFSSDRNFAVHGEIMLLVLVLLFALFLLFIVYLLCKRRSNESTKLSQLEVASPVNSTVTMFTVKVKDGLNLMPSTQAPP